ncbi:MAG: glycosyltransferase family 2 protein [Clostridia bacterium]|nr:glycosyltransferase family 2 protein [Clostridia bacterium]
MHQDDVSIVQKMNIRCPAVVANQADREEIVSWNTEWGECKMITTQTRGVGLNRNIALLAATDEILLLSDDDVVYNNDMTQAVTEAFAALPKADVIIFGMNIVKNGSVVEKRTTPIGRLHVWNSMKFGTYRIAVRRKAILNHNITFPQCFGGGCPFSAGEDSLFLKACFDAGLKVYSHSYVLGSCCKDSSSWFTGYNEKYFYDKGVLVRKLFPKTAYLMAIYFGVHFKRKTELGWAKRLRLVYAGVRAGKKMKPYAGNGSL